MVEAFYFGSAGNELFAVYHPARDPGSETLTVICPPLFSEGMRTQLALRELAIALGEAGQHVLRFDYRGTGDSAGTLAEMRLSDWRDDIHAVIREGTEITGAERVNLVGVRAGGLLLCLALRGEPPVEKIVLWDPVSSGADYLGQLRRIQANMLTRNRYLSRHSRKMARQELGGQRFPDALRHDIETIESAVYDAAPAREFSIIDTEEGAGPAAIRARRKLIRFRCNWETDSEDLMLPQPVLEGIRTCLL
jgi:pimeloyl-ACP methyl ester carboxylesterase